MDICDISVLLRDDYSSRFPTTELFGVFAPLGVFFVNVLAERFRDFALDSLKQDVAVASSKLCTAFSDEEIRYIGCSFLA